MSTTSGGSCSVGIPGTKPRARPPRTRKIGYGIRSSGAAIRSAAMETRRATRTSCSCVPKCIPRAYAAPTLLRMCGICGIVSTKGSADADRVAAMSTTLVHRGPDSFGEFSDGAAALAARRLSIIDLEALEAFLAFNSIPAPLTIFREIRKLPAGHLLLWENGRVRVERFARPAPVAAGAVRDDEEAELIEELRARVRDSVRAHLVS